MPVQKGRELFYALIQGQVAGFLTRAVPHQVEGLATMGAEQLIGEESAKESSQL